MVSKNATDLWQPVDAGMVRLLKVLVFHEQQDWLEYDQNIDLWMGNSEEKLTVKQRRILITQWVAAYEKLRGLDYQNLRYSCFQKTCCLITADGSEDHLIKSEGLDCYVVLPPLPMQSTQEPLTCETPESAAPPTDDLEDEEENNICQINDNDLEIDYKSDRNLNHNLVGRKIKAIYDNAWYTGSISWFNID